MSHMWQQQTVGLQKQAGSNEVAGSNLDGVRSDLASACSRIDALERRADASEAGLASLASALVPVQLNKTIVAALAPEFGQAMMRKATESSSTSSPISTRRRTTTSRTPSTT